MFARTISVVLALVALTRLSLATLYETGPQEQTWNVFDVTWQDWKQFKVVIDNVDVWTSEQITEIVQGDNFYTVPTYQQEGAFSWQIQARHKNGAPLGGGVTGWGVIDSGTATEVESFHKYHADFKVLNDQKHAAQFTVQWWKTADPDNPTFQHSSVMDLQPGESVDFHIEELYPFQYRIVRQDPIADLDGVGVVPDPVIGDTEDSTDTEVEIEPEGPVHQVSPVKQDLQPDQDEDTERPNATADTTDKLDKNQDARSQDARNDAKMIADIGAAGANATLATGRQAAKDAAGIKGSIDALSAGEGGPTEDQEGDADDADGKAEGPGKELFGKLQLIGGDLLDIKDAWQITVGSSALPDIGWDMPARLGGAHISFPFDEYDWLWTIVRLIFLVGLTWHWTVTCVETIKGAVS